MNAIKSFRDLLVWQKSMDLAERCYGLTRGFRYQDQQVLGHQIRKSSVSIPSNIAEGKARFYDSVYIQHLWTAHGSTAELETQLELGRRLGIVGKDEAEALIEDAREVGACCTVWCALSTAARNTALMTRGRLPLPPDAC